MSLLTPLLVASLVCASPEKSSTPAGAKASEAPVTRSAEPESLTYSKDIAPIFRQHCQDCHRPGEPAPMSLLDYKTVRRWKRSIEKVVRSGAMPPWHADPKIGHWRNDKRMPQADVDKVLRWIEADAPEGDAKDLPPAKQFAKGWRLGKPDKIFEIPTEFHVKARGEVPYKYFTVPTNFTEDKWVRAVEVRPGTPAVVHHIIVFILEPKDRRLNHRSLWKSHLGGIAPGEDPELFPVGCGKLIPAGSRLVFQMHYTPNGEATTDRSKIGLFFSDDEGRKPLRQVHVRAAMNPWFKIPAGADNHEVRSSFTFKSDARVLALMPHMHLRGKDFLFEVVRVDGTRKKILSVPRYDFDWQHNYAFETPLRVEAGDKIYCIAHFDNSADNKANPNPKRSVRWGDQTWQEMMIGFISYVDDNGEPVYQTSASKTSARKPPPDKPRESRPGKAS